jgi:DNA repair protein RadC
MLDQVKTLSLAKFVDQGTLRKIARAGSTDAAEAAAAIEIQKRCKKQQIATGQWPDRAAVAAEYFATI